METHPSKTIYFSASVALNSSCCSSLHFLSPAKIWRKKSHVFCSGLLCVEDCITSSSWSNVIFSSLGSTLCLFSHILFSWPLTFVGTLLPDSAQLMHKHFEVWCQLSEWDHTNHQCWRITTRFLPRSLAIHLSMVLHIFPTVWHWWFTALFWSGGNPSHPPFSQTPLHRTVT